MKGYHRTTAKHIHKVKKYKYPKTGNSIFHCTLPDCHFKLDVPLMLGKEVLCNICNEPFLLNEYSLKLLRPHCSNCGKIQVKDENGKKHYIHKRSTKILTEIAADTANDLESRLRAVVKPMDEDI